MSAAGPVLMVLDPLKCSAVAVSGEALLQAVHHGTAASSSITLNIIFFLFFFLVFFLSFSNGSVSLSLKSQVQVQ